MVKTPQSYICVLLYYVTLKVSFRCRMRGTTNFSVSTKVKNLYTIPCQETLEHANAVECLPDISS